MRDQGQTRVSNDCVHRGSTRYIYLQTKDPAAPGSPGQSVLRSRAVHFRLAPTTCRVFCKRKPSISPSPNTSWRCALSFWGLACLVLRAALFCLSRWQILRNQTLSWQPSVTVLASPSQVSHKACTCCHRHAPCHLPRSTSFANITHNICEAHTVHIKVILMTWLTRACAPHGGRKF